MPTRRAVLALAGSAALAGCGGSPPGGTATPTPGDGATEADADSTGTGTPTAGAGSFTLSSPAFGNGESIPTAFTGEGDDVSPPLRIAGVPDDAASLALVVDDPDAPGGRFVHWLLWNVPPETTEIPRGVPRTERVKDLDGAVQGTNDFDELGYRGPLPPEGDGPHTYVFTLSALDTTLDVDPGARRSTLDGAMDGRVIAETALRGTYER